MNNLINFTLHTQMLDDFESVNKQLIYGLTSFINDENTRKSHHFFGRYENIYIDKKNIPALELILKFAIKHAATILNCHEKKLKAGLWFNVMQPGDKTTLHRHDDDDELLSAVYYVQLVENSGFLLLHKNTVEIQVKPNAGLFVFFPPNMSHEVTENLSSEWRVSLGINIGPVDCDLNT